MSRLRFGLRTRLSLLLGLVVLATVALAWVLTGRVVLEPFARDLVRSHIRQVVYVAQEVEAGGDPRRLGERLGLSLTVRERPPGLFRRALRGLGPCRVHPLGGRRVAVCRGPRGGAAVELNDGSWLLARRPLDPDAPRRRILLVLAAVAGVILLSSALLATWVTRPIRTSVAAMERVAGGDLGHRLPESSSGEVGEVARAFNRMADRVRTLLEAERSLMASISHELRTPLARLRLELELLEDHDVPARRLAAMASDIAEVDRLVDETLEASRLSIGDMALEPVDLDLREVVERALAQAALSEHEVRLIGPEHAPARGDAKRLVRAVKNLLDNAGKYAPPDSAVEVAVEARAIEVRDRGPGVPPDEIPRLFEPFFRGTRGAGSGATGYGLGLMIARQVAELHGGTLEARNRPGGGLVVRLDLGAGP